MVEEEPAIVGNLVIPHSLVIRHSSFVIGRKKPRPEGQPPAKNKGRHGNRPVAFPVMNRIWKRKWFWPLVVILVAVLVVRLMLAIWVRDYVNRKLNEMDEYRGHVAAVDIHLWRGASTIHEVIIEKTTGKVPVPFFSAPAVDLSVEWGALWHGAVVGEIEFYRPKMNFVNAASKANSQFGVDKPWTEKIKQLFPLKFNRFAVHDMKLEMAEVPLTKLNDFAKAYGHFTFEEGTLKVATELNSKNGAFNGYVEPVFDHMSIFDPAHDSDNPIDFIWQGIVGGLTRIIRNHPKDRFGTRVPLSGNFEDPVPDVMTTIVNVFKNAFIKAFEGKLENENIELPKVDKEKH